jgi:glycosyltransferase involved in cell wall biosynthesis
MKTILLLVTKAELGGAQQFVTTLSKGLRDFGWNVIVGCGTHGYLEEELVKERIPFHIFKNLGRSYNPFKSIFFIFELHSFIKKNKIDILHLNSSNTLFGGLSAQCARIKSVATIHGLSFADPNHTNSKLKQFFYRIIFKLLLSFIDQPVFVSKHNQNFAEKIGLTKKGVMIHNGIDADPRRFVSRDEARRFLESKTGAALQDYYIIGSIGRYAYPKNYEFLITNFDEIKKIIPNAKLVLIGEGPDRKKYQELIKKQTNGVDIVLTGEIREGSRYLKAFDLFVLPSIYEGMPMVILESLAVNIPIIASNVGGISEIISTPNLFETNSKQDFLRKLSTLHNFFKTATQQFEEEFKSSTMVKEYIKIYEKF